MVELHDIWCDFDPQFSDQKIRPQHPGPDLATEDVLRHKFSLRSFWKSLADFAHGAVELISGFPTKMNS